MLRKGHECRYSRSALMMTGSHLSCKTWAQDPSCRGARSGAGAEKGAEGRRSPSSPKSTLAFLLLPLHPRPKPLSCCRKPGNSHQLWGPGATLDTAGNQKSLQPFLSLFLPFFPGFHLQFLKLNTVQLNICKMKQLEFCCFIYFGFLPGN